MKNKITISTIINSEIKKTWDFYTSPKHIVNWNFAIQSWHCPSATNNLQVGGKYTARMEAKDGSFGFDFEATYNSINTEKDFTYTMPDSREVTVVFTPNSDRTSIIITFDPENQNPEEMQRQGWQAILDNFKNYVENN